jgi:hypothetical protein
MLRTIHQWWRAAIAAAAIMSPRAAAADQPVHAVQILATRYALEPATIRVTAGEPAKRAGGHVFQLNVSDSFATTMGQIARGGPAGDNWHLGFNISRKFY